MAKKFWSNHLRSNVHKNNIVIISTTNGVEIVKSAFQQRIVSYRIHSDNFHVNVVEFFNNISIKVFELIKDNVRTYTCIKLNMELFGLYFNPKTELQDIKSFNTPFKIICSGSNILSIIEEMSKMIDQKADELAERDSGNYLS